MSLKRMDNVGIVVEDLDGAIEFFRELGLTLEGRAMIEGEWAGRITGLGDQRVEIAMMRTPDGHSRIELSRFLAPTVASDHRNAPVNSLGYLRVMFTVDDLDETLDRLSQRGRNSWAKWCSIWTYTGFAMYAGRREFCWDLRRNWEQPALRRQSLRAGKLRLCHCGATDPR